MHRGSAACFAFVTLVSAISRAEPTPEDHALASALFREAKTLLDAGVVPEACRKLEESHRLEPAGGTLLNLAVCREREGKTASAFARYREARIYAERDRQDDRLELIDERLPALSAKLSKLVVVCEETGVEIVVDDRPLRPPEWGTQMPVDPGEHVIEARAPGKRPWRETAVVGADADVKTVRVPELVPDEAAAKPPAVVPPPRVVEPPKERPRDRTLPTLVAGAGLAAIVVGGAFGVRAIVKEDEASTTCTTRPCSAASVELNESAKTSADIATGAIAVGVVALGVGTWLWLSSAPRAKTVRFAPGLVRF